jgi:hypothetical protein
MPNVVSPRGIRRVKESIMLAAVGGFGIVGIIVLVLIILAVLWFVRGRGTG